MGERESLLARTTEHSRINAIVSVLILALGLAENIPSLAVLGGIALVGTVIVAGIHEVRGVARRNARKALKHLPSDYQT